MNKDDIEDCHRLAKADPKNTVVRFFDHRFYCETLDEKLNLRKKDSTKLGFQASAVGNSKQQAKFKAVGVSKGL